MKKKSNRSFRIMIAAAICFIAAVMAFTPAVSYIAGSSDSLLSYATDEETASGQNGEEAKPAAEEKTVEEKAAEENSAGEQTTEENAAEETVTDAAETDKNKTVENNTEYPAVEFNETVDGVGIKLAADEGVFPEGVSLSASRVMGAELKKVDKALDSERGENSEVDSSYTFDIKVLDRDGKEVQPADGKDVSLSFVADKVADEKYSTRVYHIEDGKKELDATELKVTTDGDAATVTTDGFSYYTVEFTYGDKQYVLEGDGVVKLDDLLKEIGIKGEVKGVSVSAPELFGVIMGTRKGVSYTTRFMNGETKKVPTNDPKGTVRYVASYKPFDTEEWMDITMKDGRKYHVIVTDALMGDNTIDKDIPGVSQGIGSEFAETIPVATIWINDGIFTENRESRHVGDHEDWSLSFIPGELMTAGSGKYDEGFKTEYFGDEDKKGSAQYYGNHFVIYDSNEKALTESVPVEKTVEAGGGTAYQSCNDFKGVVGTYKYSNAAVYTDENGNEQRADVYIEYSDPMISIETPTDATKASEWDDVKVGLFGPNIITNGKDKDIGQRYALDITVRPYVRTHSDGNVIGGNLIEGRFFFPMVHLNVKRSADGFKTFYKSNPELVNYDESTHLYSEQVILKKGIAADKKGNEIFIPGGDGDPYFNYIPAIEISDVVGSENYGQYVVYPPLIEDGSITDELIIDGKTLSARNSFYYGFLTCAVNGDFEFRHNSSSLTNESGMHSYVLTSSSDFNYRLRHSTFTVGDSTYNLETGGTIQTTTYGNHSGRPADDGAENIIGPSTKAAAYGQTVVYTFTPKPGYSLKNVYVWDGTGDFPSIDEMKTRPDVKKINEGDGTDGTYEEHDDGDDGIRYTYTFHGIQSNKAIHVVWDQTKLEIQKKTSGSGKDDKDTFLFKLRITKPDNTHVNLKNTADEKAAARFTEMSEGWYSFELTNGETFQIPTDLTTDGDTWEVQEIPYPDTNKYGKLDGWTPSKTGIETGKFVQGKTDRVTITNNRKKPAEEGKVPITVKKVWQDDETLRPKSLTVTIEKAADIGVYIEDFRTALTGLGLGEGQITGIRYGTANEYRDARKDTKVKVSEAKAAPDRGEGFVYFWIDPEDPTAIKFYSEKTIYLFNKVDYDDNKAADGNRVGLCENFYALEDISGLAHVHTDFCTSFANMFNDCLSLYDLHPIAKWNTTNVRSLQKFLQADNPNSTGTGKGPMIYDNLSPLKNWDTENVETMRRAFKGAMKLKDISPVKDWDTGRVVSLYETFFRTEVGIKNNQGYFENWNVTCVDDFYQMFKNSATGSQTTPAAADLPNWGNNETYPRPATGNRWNENGTYLPKDPADTPASIKNWNDASRIFDNHKKKVLSTTAHDVDDDGNWIYTFYVDDDGAEWNVYETIPKAYDSEYRVSASYTNNLEGEDLITSADTMGVGKKNNPYKGAEPGSTTTLTNHQKVHKLTIKKDLPFVENSEENAQPFEFNIVLTTNEGNPYDISQTDQYKALEENGSIIEQSTGKYTLIIKGESAEEFELPAGIKYTVTEDVSKLPVGWKLLRSNNTSGVLTEDKEASFANTNSTNFIVNKIWKGDSYNGVRLPARPIESDKVKIEVEAGGQTYVSDPENMFRDDPADYWAYEFAGIPAGTAVTSVKETVLPEHYDYEVIRPEKDGDPYTVVNTLKEKTLTVKKNTQGDQNGIFDFEVRFWINNSTEKAHPVKIGHSQIFNLEVQHTYDAEFVFENGITINGDDVAGVYELKDNGNTVVGTPFNPGGRRPTPEELATIQGTMGSVEVKGTHQTFRRLHETNKKLSDFNLQWNGQDTEIVYTEQGADVVAHMTTNGRRIDWYIIPTLGEDEEKEINIRTPYGLRTENNDDGKKQLPEGVYGDPDTGTYTFRLRNGESIEFPHLPATLSYDVTEIRKEGWELTDRTPNYQGDLNKDETVVFGNGKRKGKLIIQKATKYDVAGTFTFRGVFGRLLDTSKIKGTEVTPVYPAGEKETVKTVTKFERHQDSVAYTVDGIEYFVSESGVHTGDGNYLPALDVDYPDSFTLKETVDGKTYAMNYKFIPTIEPDTERITYNEVKISSATYEFKLDNGGKAVFGGMPFGTTYDVEEIDIPEKWELESLTNDSNGDMHADGFMNVGTAREISEAEPDTISYTFTNKRTGKDVTTEYKTITRYITYTKYTVDGEKIADTVRQPLKIRRTKTVDYDAEPNDTFKLFSIKASESDSPKITYSKWEIAEGSAGAVTSPDYPGWTPNIKVVPEWAFNQDDPQDEWVHVIYTPDNAKKDSKKGSKGSKGSSGTDTGDSENVALWIGLLAAACIALLAGYIHRRKKN